MLLFIQINIQLSLNMRLVSAKEAKEYFHITGATLYQWKAKGKIKAKQLSSKKILYDIDSFDDFQPKQKKNVIYARVSNTKQADDLSKQIEIVKSYAISNGVKIDKVYKDIASGMNENRKEFNLMLREIFAGNVDKVFISYKDRLTRFGFDYFKNIFSEFGTKIVVLDELEETNSDFQKELANDLISIIHHFSMKLYSNRRKKLKEIEKLIESED